MTSGKSVNEPRPPYGGLPPDADPDVRGSYQAMVRAAARAREIAKQTGTDLIRVKDGRVVRVKPEAAGGER